jgi:colanic acid/amylovoran biosynthesis glycosyltransferase
MAFRIALETEPDTELVMAGSGELLEMCKTLATAWGISDRVSFPGAVAHAETAELFAHACCFVQHSVTPSYGDAEGTPVAILEAGAAGLPVVATRHAGISDVVIDGETGYLTAEHDVNGMAAAMVELLGNPSRCRSMGNAARQHVRSNFSIEEHVSRLQNAIDSARDAR